MLTVAWALVESPNLQESASQFVDLTAIKDLQNLQ